jgi:hypothetical protein
MPDTLVDDGDPISLAKPENGKAGRPGEKCALIPNPCTPDISTEPYGEKPSEKDWLHETSIR